MIRIEIEIGDYGINEELELTSEYLTKIAKARKLHKSFLDENTETNPCRDAREDEHPDYVKPEEMPGLSHNKELYIKDDKTGSIAGGFAKQTVGRGVRSNKIILDDPLNSSTKHPIDKFRVEQETKIFTPPRTVRLKSAEPEQVDSRGMPWNPEIHSETKAKNKSDGTWRYRRGVDKNLILELEEAQLPKQLEIPEPPTASTMRESEKDIAPTAITFMDLMKKITNAKLAGQITQERIHEISFQVIGDKNLSKLSTQQDKIPEVSAIIDAELLM